MMLKFAACLIIPCLMMLVTAQNYRKLNVASSRKSYSYDMDSYSYNMLIGYVNTTIFLYNENPKYDIYITAIKSRVEELAGQYEDKIGYGEYGTFHVYEQKFDAIMYYDSVNSGKMYDDNLVYVVVKAKNEHQLESSVTYISKDSKFEYTYVSAYAAKLSEDGSFFTAQANITITANLPASGSYSYSYSFDI